MRVLRIYHAGGTRAQQAREAELLNAGVDCHSVVPETWDGATLDPSSCQTAITTLPVKRAGDVNRHTYQVPEKIVQLCEQFRPDLVDIHEEPFSAVAHQLLRVIPPDLPVVMYTAQNIDKRLPPPFSRWEHATFGRVSGLYPCSRQAAAVARGRGYRGLINVLPLGFDPEVNFPGHQRHDAAELHLALAGRLVAEKGVREAIHTLAAVQQIRPARLTIAGSGPEVQLLDRYAKECGVEGRVVHAAWLAPESLAALYRDSHFVLVPSSATGRWVEQFGRAVVEAQACGAVVLAYASGAIPEAASGGSWLAAEGDMTGLGRAAARLATDAALWDDWRDRGLSAAQNKTWEAVARAQGEFYRAAISAAPNHAARAQRSTRRTAREEFGASARASGAQSRPWAIPVLRDRPALGRVAGAAVDWVIR